MYVKEGVTTSVCEANRILNLKIISVGNYYTSAKEELPSDHSSLLGSCLRADQEVTGQRWCNEVL